MHSYQHHIKDFNNATRHLTRVERALYRDAIELYYETEKPLPADDFDRLARRLMAVSDEEKHALQAVLGEFFTKTGDVYSHDRCDEEIEKFHTAKTLKSAAGKASAEAKRKRAEERKRQREGLNQTGVEQVLNSVETEPQQTATNHKPETINQELKHFGESADSPPAKYRFAEFWGCYPKKRGKAPCEKKWRVKKLDTLADKLIADVTSRIQHDQRWRDGFIPDPLTYLTQERWEDELGGSATTTSSIPPDEDYTAWRRIGAQRDIHPGSTEDNRDYVRRVKREVQAA